MVVKAASCAPGDFRKDMSGPASPICPENMDALDIAKFASALVMAMIRSELDQWPPQGQPTCNDITISQYHSHHLMNSEIEGKLGVGYPCN